MVCNFLQQPVFLGCNNAVDGALEHSSPLANKSSPKPSTFICLVEILAIPCTALSQFQAGQEVLCEFGR